MSDDKFKYLGLFTLKREGGIYHNDPDVQEIIDDNYRLRAENKKLRALLGGRDQFIVENGLWSEFTKQVDKLTSAAAAALKEMGE